MYRLVLGLAIVIAIGAATTGQGALAQEEGATWIEFTKNSDGDEIYSGKRGSYELTTSKAGTPIALVLGQVQDTTTKSITYSKWYVATRDCDAGLGKLVVLTVGGEYEGEVDYVAQGNNVASALGDIICSIYFSNKAEEQSKGV